MNTLNAINKKIEELKKQADKIVTAEKRQAIAKARDLIAKFGLSAEDVGLGKAGKRGRAASSGKPARAGASVAKYCDPATGKTWTGVGRAPAWIAAAKERSKFLIVPDAGTAAPAAVKQAMPKKKTAAGKAVVKAAKPAAPTKTLAAKKAKRKAANAAGGASVAESIAPAQAAEGSQG